MRLDVFHLRDVMFRLHMGMTGSLSSVLPNAPCLHSFVVISCRTGKVPQPPVERERLLLSYFVIVLVTKSHMCTSHHFHFYIRYHIASLPLLHESPPVLHIVFNMCATAAARVWNLLLSPLRHCREETLLAATCTQTRDTLVASRRKQIVRKSCITQHQVFGLVPGANLVHIPYHRLCCSCILSS